ncbi:hypothetical protein BCGKFG_BCGKFG_14685, partial [Dysosmobacter welbionis]
VGTHPVIMAVGADHAAIQADVRCLYRRHRLQLRGGEVILCDAVLFVQQLHHRQLHTAGLLRVPDRLAAQQQVQGLSGDGLRQRLLVLLRAQV